MMMETKANPRPRSHPVIFDAHMVRALIEGRKRRFSVPVSVPAARLYGQAGDWLWVRETWGAVSVTEDPASLDECQIEYRADLPPGCADYPGEWPLEEARGYDSAPKWRSASSMPKRFARIWLRIERIIPQRLCDITAGDALREGFPADSCDPKDDWRAWFKQIWDHRWAKRRAPWESNPWVWAISFEMSTGGVNPLPRLFRVGGARKS